MAANGTNAPYDVSVFDAYGSLHGYETLDPTPTLSDTIPYVDPVSFGGQYGYYTDPTGYVLCTHRYYDPNNGRWLNRDPIGYAGGINLYGFCGGNPVMFADPDGTTSILQTLAQWMFGFEGASGQATINLGKPRRIVVAPIPRDHGTSGNGDPRSNAFQDPGEEPDAYGASVATAQSRALHAVNQGVPHIVGNVIMSAGMSAIPGGEGAEASAEAMVGLRQSFIETLSAIRAMRVGRQEYIQAVTGLKAQGEHLLASGYSEEEVAMTLNAERRAIGVQFKQKTPPAKLQEIYARNIARYGDPLGPTVAWLREHDESWQQIIDGASRVGGSDLQF